MHTSLKEQIAKLENDIDARILSARIRWKNGFSCPQCGSRVGTQLKNSLLIQCAQCRKQTSPTANTVLHGIKRLKSFLQILIKLMDGTVGTTREISEELNIPYKTAWNLAKKARTLLGLLQSNKRHIATTCFHLTPALTKNNCQSTAGFIGSLALTLVVELRKTIKKSINVLFVELCCIGWKFARPYIDRFANKKTFFGTESKHAQPQFCRGSPPAMSSNLRSRSPPAMPI